MVPNVGKSGEDNSVLEDENGFNLSWKFERREEHLEKLADVYAEKKDSTRAQEVKKLAHIERVKKVATKHRWFLKSNFGMVRSLLIPNYVVEKFFQCGHRWQFFGSWEVYFQGT